MNLLIILTALIIGACAFPLFSIVVLSIKSWRKLNRLRLQGTKAEARIMRVTILDDAFRYLPFVKMEIEVYAEKSFLAIAEGFYSSSQLSNLHIGSTIQVVFHPSDDSQVLLMKESLNHTQTTTSTQ